MPNHEPRKESLIDALRRILGMKDVRELVGEAAKSPEQRKGAGKGPSRPYRKARTAIEYQKKLERLRREREERNRP